MKKKICLSILAVAAILGATVHAQAETKDLPATETENSVVTFSTTDLDGEEVTEKVFEDAKLVMINFWEPWCGPCVREIPDLAKLYEEYQEQGFMILGVFSTKEMESDVKLMRDELQITYPILHCDENLEQYMTDFVPTTIFVDGEGTVLSQEPIISAYSYEVWEETIQGYLEEMGKE